MRGYGSGLSDSFVEAIGWVEKRSRGFRSMASLKAKFGFEEDWDIICRGLYHILEDAIDLGPVATLE